MNNKTEKVRQAKNFFDSISIMIDSALNKAKFNKKKKAVIQSLNVDGTVNITLNDELYSNIKVRSGLSPVVGEVVYIEIPNGDFSQAFVDTSQAITGSSGELDHNPATILDSNTIDFLLADQQISGNVKTQMSITSDTSGIKLSNDSTTPGNSKYYGTDLSGVKGYNSLPTIPTKTSDLTNDSNFIASAQSPVQSVAGKTGTVTLAKTDVGLDNVDNTSDLNKPISNATQTALNGKIDDSQVLTDVPENALFTDTVYTHPSTHSADIIIDGTTNKAFTSTEKIKLLGIATGAEVNVSPDWNAFSGDAQILNKPTTISGYGITDAYTKDEIDNKVSAVYKYKGSGATYSSLPSSNQVIGDVYNVTDTGINYAWDGTGWDDIGGVEALATALNNGLMSKEDFSKLAGIQANANNYSHPSTHSPSIITQDSSNRFVTDVEKTSWNGAVTDKHVHSNKSALDLVSGTNTGDENASDILTKIKTVDGAESGLDADTVDGQHYSDITNYVDNSVNAIQIGGRNLVLNSNTLSGTGWTQGGTFVLAIDSDGLTYFESTSNGTENWLASSPVNALPNTQYTISIKVKATNLDKGLSIPIFYNGSWVNYDYLEKDTSGGWITKIFVITTNASGGQIRVACDNYFNTTGTVYCKAPKIEIGNKATDWTPAPEDVQSQIDSATNRITNSEVALEGKSSITHNHIISNVDGLQTALDAKYQSGEVIMNTNPFGGKQLFINNINNAIFNATKRWTVTGSIYNSDDSFYSTISEDTLNSLFDGDYEGGMSIPAGKHAFILIDFGASHYPGYPYGNLFLSHYYVDYSQSASMRVYCNYEPHGIGWHTVNFSTFYDDGIQSLILTAPQGFYDISQMEFTIFAPSGTNAIITEVDWRLDRPGSNEMPVLDKYKQNNLYYDLIFKTGNTTKLILGSNGVITSSVATGIAPLTITSTTKVPNLNVDMLDDCSVNDAGTAISDLWTASKITTQLALKANIASPTFTGTPLAPTATSGTNTTQIATTAFVQTAMGSAGLGDMLKSSYDSNSDGKVNSADNADKVNGIKITVSAITPTTPTLNDLWIDLN